MSSRRLVMRFKAYAHRGEVIFEVRGKAARTLWHLVQAGPRGITALEMSNTWRYVWGPISTSYGMITAWISPPSVRKT